jgi:hypothetical protein
VFDRLLERNLQLGLARYDPSDLNARALYAGLYRSGAWGGRLARILKAPELVAPRLWRTLLRQGSTIVPTAYYHLGLALLDARRLRPERTYDQLILEWAERAVEERLGSWEHHCWGTSFPYLCTDLRVRSDEPCMHTTARLGHFFRRMAEEGLGRQWDDVARSVALAIEHYFRWTETENGGLVVSYWFSSDDEVINIGADAAAFLAEVGSGGDSACHRVLGLLRTLEIEQRPDGAWDYWTTSYRTRAGRAGFIDHHHTAMVLAALHRLARCPKLPADARVRAGALLSRGLSFYLRELFNGDGMPLAAVGSKRLADVAGFCEGVILLSELAKAPVTAEQEVGIRPGFANEILDRSIALFYDAASGDTASDVRWGRRWQLRSIRWGSGLLMEAIARHARASQHAAATNSTPG